MSSVNNIQLIIFDLDGVLIDAKIIHFHALNAALGEEYRITWDEHLASYDGLKTTEKLNLLSKHKNLPKEDYHKIWTEKQKHTMNSLREIPANDDIRKNLMKLREMGFRLALCTNSIRETTELVLNRLGIHNLFDSVLSNEDVKRCKPNPDIYWKTMMDLGVNPENVVVVEDSPHGLLAAHRSGAWVIRVTSSIDTNCEYLVPKILDINMKTRQMKWKNDKLNILIPMAGNGSRFFQAGYTNPKPLIDVNGKTMIQTVVENLNIDAHYIYVVRSEHRIKYNLDFLLKSITPGCKIIEVESLTQGAACTALLAKEFINNDQPLLFANSDQYIEWDSNEFMYKMQETDVDAGILTFRATSPKWSFVSLDDLGFVNRVAEKEAISDIATVGCYYWKHGSDFVKFAEEMVEADIRVNGEFYICPVFNQAIQASKKISIFPVNAMWGLGTPEDLKSYLDNFSEVKKTS